MDIYQVAERKAIRADLEVLFLGRASTVSEEPTAASPSSSLPPKKAEDTEAATTNGVSLQREFNRLRGAPCDSAATIVERRRAVIRVFRSFKALAADTARRLVAHWVAAPDLTSIPLTIELRGLVVHVLGDVAGPLSVPLAWEVEEPLKVASREVAARIDAASQPHLEATIQIPLCAAVHCAGFDLFVEAAVGFTKDSQVGGVVRPATDQFRTVPPGDGVAHVNRQTEYVTRAVGMTFGLKHRAANSNAFLPSESRIDLAPDGDYYIRSLARARPPLLEVPVSAEGGANANVQARAPAATGANSKTREGASNENVIATGGGSQQHEISSAAATATGGGGSHSGVPIPPSVRRITHAGSCPPPWSALPTAPCHRLRERCEFRLLPQLLREGVLGTALSPDSWAGKAPTAAVEGEVLEANRVLYLVATPRLANFFLILDRVAALTGRADVADAPMFAAAATSSLAPLPTSATSVLSSSSSAHLNAPPYEYTSEVGTEGNLRRLFADAMNAYSGGVPDGRLGADRNCRGGSTDSFIEARFADLLRLSGGGPNDRLTCGRVKEVFHAFGVNMRLIGRVVELIEEAIVSGRRLVDPTLIYFENANVASGPTTREGEAQLQRPRLPVVCPAPLALFYARHPILKTVRSEMAGRALAAVLRRRWRTEATKYFTENFSEDESGHMRRRAKLAEKEDPIKGMPLTALLYPSSRGPSPAMRGGDESTSQGSPVTKTDRKARARSTIFLPTEADDDHSPSQPLAAAVATVGGGGEGGGGGGVSEPSPLEGACAAHSAMVRRIMERPAADCEAIINAMLGHATIEGIAAMAGDNLAAVNGTDEAFWAAHMVPMIRHKFGYEWTFYREFASESNVMGGVKTVLSTGSRVRTRHCPRPSGEASAVANRCPMPKPLSLTRQAETKSWGLSGGVSTASPFAGTKRRLPPTSGHHGNASGALLDSSAATATVPSPARLAASSATQQSTAVIGSGGVSPLPLSSLLPPHASSTGSDAWQAALHSTVLTLDLIEATIAADAAERLANKEFAADDAHPEGFSVDYTDGGADGEAWGWGEVEIANAAMPQSPSPAATTTGEQGAAEANKKAKGEEKDGSASLQQKGGAPVRVGERQDARIAQRACALAGVTLVRGGDRLIGATPYASTGIAALLSPTAKGMVTRGEGPFYSSAALQEVSSGATEPIINAMRDTMRAHRRLWGSTGDYRQLPHLFVIAELYRLAGKYPQSADVSKKMCDTLAHDNGHNFIGLVDANLRVAKALALAANEKAALSHAQNAVAVATEHAGHSSQLLTRSLLALLDLYEGFEEEGSGGGGGGAAAPSVSSSPSAFGGGDPLAQSINGGGAFGANHSSSNYTKKKIDLAMRLQPLCAGGSGTIAAARIEARAALLQLQHASAMLRQKEADNAIIQMEIDAHRRAIAEAEANEENERRKRSGSSAATPSAQQQHGSNNNKGSANATTVGGSFRSSAAALRAKKPRRLVRLAEFRQHVTDAEAALASAIAAALQTQGVDDELVFFMVKYTAHTRRTELLPVLCSAVTAFVHPSSPHYGPSVGALTSLILSGVKGLCDAAEAHELTARRAREEKEQREAAEALAARARREKERASGGGSSAFGREGGKDGSLFSPHAADRQSLEIDSGDEGGLVLAPLRPPQRSLRGGRGPSGADAQPSAFAVYRAMRAAAQEALAGPSATNAGPSGARMALRDAEATLTKPSPTPSKAAPKTLSHTSAAEGNGQRPGTSSLASDPNETHLRPTLAVLYGLFSDPVWASEAAYSLQSVTAKLLPYSTIVLAPSDAEGAGVGGGGGLLDGHLPSDGDASFIRHVSFRGAGSFAASDGGASDGGGGIPLGNVSLAASNRSRSMWQSMRNLQESQQKMDRKRSRSLMRPGEPDTSSSSSSSSSAEPSDDDDSEGPPLVPSGEKGRVGQKKLTDTLTSDAAFGETVVLLGGDDAGNGARRASDSVSSGAEPRRSKLTNDTSKKSASEATTPIPLGLQQEMFTVCAVSLFRRWLRALLRSVPADALPTPWEWGLKTAARPFCALLSRASDLYAVCPLIGFKVFVALADELELSNAEIARAQRSSAAIAQSVPTIYTLATAAGGNGFGNSSTSRLATPSSPRGSPRAPLASTFGATGGTSPRASDERIARLLEDVGVSYSNPLQREPWPVQTPQGQRTRYSPLAAPFLHRIAVALWGAAVREMAVGGHLTPPERSAFVAEPDPKRVPRFDLVRQLFSFSEALASLFQCLQGIYGLDVPECVNAIGPLLAEERAAEGGGAAHSALFGGNNGGGSPAARKASIFGAAEYSSPPPPPRGDHSHSPSPSSSSPPHPTAAAASSPLASSGRRGSASPANASSPPPPPPLLTFSDAVPRCMQALVTTLFLGVELSLTERQLCRATAANPEGLLQGGGGGARAAPAARRKSAMGGASPFSTRSPLASSPLSVGISAAAVAPNPNAKGAIAWALSGAAERRLYAVGLPQGLLVRLHLKPSASCSSSGGGVGNSNSGAMTARGGADSLSDRDRSVAGHGNSTSPRAPLSPSSAAAAASPIASAIAIVPRHEVLEGHLSATRRVPPHLTLAYGWPFHLIMRSLKQKILEAVPPIIHALGRRYPSQRAELWAQCAAVLSGVFFFEQRLYTPRYCRAEADRRLSQHYELFRSAHACAVVGRAAMGSLAGQREVEAARQQFLERTLGDEAVAAFDSAAAAASQSGGGGGGSGKQSLFVFSLNVSSGSSSAAPPTGSSLLRTAWKRKRQRSFVLGAAAMAAAPNIYDPSAVPLDLTEADVESAEGHAMAWGAAARAAPSKAAAAAIVAAAEAEWEAATLRMRREVAEAVAAEERKAAALLSAANGGDGGGDAKGRQRSADKNDRRRRRVTSAGAEAKTSVVANTTAAAANGTVASGAMPARLPPIISTSTGAEAVVSPSSSQPQRKKATFGASTFHEAEEHHHDSGDDGDGAVTATTVTPKKAMANNGTVLSPIRGAPHPKGRGLLPALGPLSSPNDGSSSRKRGLTPAALSPAALKASGGSPSPSTRKGGEGLAGVGIRVANATREGDGEEASSSASSPHLSRLHRRASEVASRGAAVLPQGTQSLVVEWRTASAAPPANALIGVFAVPSDAFVGSAAGGGAGGDALRKIVVPSAAIAVAKGLAVRRPSGSVSLRCPSDTGAYVVALFHQGTTPVLVSEVFMIVAM